MQHYFSQHHDFCDAQFIFDKFTSWACIIHVQEQSIPKDDKIIKLNGVLQLVQEAIGFLITSAMKPEIKINQKGICRFIYDNSHFNSKKKNYYNTFHVKGGMYTVVTQSALSTDEKTSRLTEIPASAVLRTFGAVILKHLDSKEIVQGFKQLRFKINYEFPTSEQTFFVQVRFLGYTVSIKRFV